MRSTSVLLFVVMYTVGYSGPAIAQSPDRQLCLGPDPDVSISGCTAIIQSGNETEQNLAEAFYNRGVAYRQKGQLDRAIEDYDQAIRLHPNYVFAYVNRGGIYAGKEQWDKALEDFNRAIQLNPNFADAFYSRGAVYRHKGEYDRAIKDYDQAIRFNPNYAAAFYYRGVARRALGQQARADADFAKATQLNPELSPPAASIPGGAETPAKTQQGTQAIAGPSHRSCAPSYPKAGTVIINTGDRQQMTGHILHPLGEGGKFTGTVGRGIPAGPVVIWVFRTSGDQFNKVLKGAGLNLREGSAYVWHQPGTTPFDLQALKQLKYLCDFDVSLSDDHLNQAFLSTATAQPR